MVMTAMTLGKYVKGLRTKRAQPLTQQQVAKASGLDDSLVSFLESDKKVRFETLRSVCKDGLKVSADEWAMIKLLWLEQASDEPVFTATLTKARETLEIKESKATEEFIEKAVGALLHNLAVIDRENLRKDIIEILSDPKGLTLLKQLRGMVRAFNPEKK